MIYKKLEDSGGSFFEKWVNANGKYHREDGPAYISHYPDGSIRYEEFYIDGESHRKTGPACIQYNPKGLIKSEDFWIYGEYLGRDKVGFWALWKRLDEGRRQAPSILKCLARYS